MLCLTLVSSLFILGSCRKASDNGKLDGQWQIMGIETLDDAKSFVPEKRLYICLNLHVVQLTTAGGVGVSGNMRYEKGTGEIDWDFPYHETETGKSALRQWGVYSNPVTFHVVKLDGKSLVLKSDKSVITCRRF